MAELIARLDSLDGVDEAHKDFYVEVDGKFVPNIKPVDGWALENVAGLKTVLSEAKEDLRKARDRNAGFGDLQPDDVKGKLEKLAELMALDPEKEADRIAQEKMKSTLEQMQTKAREADEAHKAEVSGLRAELQSHLIDAEATKALVAQDGNVTLLLPHVKSRTRLVIKEGGGHAVQVLDESGNPKVNDSAGNLQTIEQFVSEMKTMEDFRPAFKGNGASGGGGSSQGGEGAGGSGGVGSGGGSGRVIQVRRSDEAAMKANFEKIASGEAVVVDD